MAYAHTLDAKTQLMKRFVAFTQSMTYSTPAPA